MGKTARVVLLIIGLEGLIGCGALDTSDADVMTSSASQAFNVLMFSQMGRDRLIGQGMSGVISAPLANMYASLASNSGIALGLKLSTAPLTWHQLNTNWVTCQPTGCTDPNQSMIAVAPTFDPFHHCQFVGWRDPWAGSFFWTVESWIQDSAHPFTGACIPQVNSINSNGVIDSSPGVASFTFMSGGQMRQAYWAFAAKANGTNSLLQFNVFDSISGTWTGWVTKTDGALSRRTAPSAISQSPGNVDLVVHGTDSHVYHRHISVSGGTATWTSWGDLGMPPNFGASLSPSVGAVSSTQLDVCVNTLGDPGDTVYCRSRIGNWDTGSWTDWRYCRFPGSGTAYSPSVTTDGTNTIVAVTSQDDLALYGEICNP